MTLENEWEFVYLKINISCCFIFVKLYLQFPLVTLRKHKSDSLKKLRLAKELDVTRQEPLKVLGLQSIKNEVVQRKSEGFTRRATAIILQNISKWLLQTWLLCQHKQ